MSLVWLRFGIDEVSSTLSWVSLPAATCFTAVCDDIQSEITELLDQCCSASDKPTELQLKAGYFCIGETG